MHKKLEVFIASLNQNNTFGFFKFVSFPVIDVTKSAKRDTLGDDDDGHSDDPVVLVMHINLTNLNFSDLKK